MKPEDVPEELVRAATRGYLGLEARRVIANVWPEIERRVREQVAAEIRETARSLREDGQISQDGWRGYVAAAYIAQEGARIAWGES